AGGGWGWVPARPRYFYSVRQSRGRAMRAPTFPPWIWLQAAGRRGRRLVHHDAGRRIYGGKRSGAPAPEQFSPSRIIKSWTICALRCGRGLGVGSRKAAVFLQRSAEPQAGSRKAAVLLQRSAEPRARQRAIKKGKSDKLFPYI
ncbi:hypothetical protein SAMN05192585_1391, partial [Acetanaerobacterium elongatum]